jgi:hypothetical protein
LIATTGPWFGTVPFNPTLVGLRTVGKMTWKAQSVGSGTLSYGIDGVTVSKTLYRQTLRYDDRAGTFYGSAKMRLCTPRAGPPPASTGGLTPIAIYDCLQFSFQATFAVNPTAGQLVAVSKIPITGPSTECTF